MQIKRKHKITALLLVATMLCETIFPTISMALTSMDTQPEVWAYQPVDATDNVGLTSGAFNYTIPVTSIPEYPMAIGYSSGMGMEQEAGVFGFGFSGFSGAISRNMIGLPDDLNGATKKYKYENQKKWDASIKGTLGVGMELGGMQLGINESMQMGYNNYKGVYGALGIGLGLSGKLGNTGIAPAGGLGASLISDSRESGIKFGLGSSVGISASLYGGKGSAYGSVAGYSLNKTLDNKSSKLSQGSYLITNVGKSVFPAPTSTSSSALAALSYVLPVTTGFGVSLTIPIPITPPASLSVTAAYSQYDYGNGVIDKKGFGFLYLNNYHRENPKRDEIADMTIEGEDSYNENARNTPVYLQRDFFSANAMGLSGSMQLYQNENGVVSRNYNRDQFRRVGILSTSTDRKEVYPWVNISQTKMNKGVDIISLLKKKNNSEDKDFDKAMFDELEVKNLVNEKDKFGKAEFKMRGDLAGEFNLSSKNFKDHEPNKYDLLHISGINEDPSYSTFKQEKNMPLYFPVTLTETQDNYDKGEKTRIEKGTNIKYKTIGDILAAYKDLCSIDPVTNSNNNTKEITNPFNFNQSFYAHYNYNASSSLLMNDNLRSMNILKQLNENPDARKNYFQNLIGSIEVQSTAGLRYFFNLPVFNKSRKNIQLSGYGDKAPLANGNSDYHSFDDKDRSKVTVDDEYMYPYAWLLTAIVGDDYIDYDNIPGPSDGDIGYWVKFKYVKACDNFRWRAPFTGMNHIAGIIHDNSDDVYTVSTGEKEIYYLAEIESANYLCKYIMQKRFDARDANHIANGNAYNSLIENESSSVAAPCGPNFQFLVTQIDLYKKHSSGDNSQKRNISDMYGKPIKSTVFEYDYSTSSMVPNNSAEIEVKQASYYYKSSEASTVSGKATLRKVQHIAYDVNGNPTPLPSYQFTYWRGDHSQYNPPYDKDCVDQWGHYFVDGRISGNSDGPNSSVNYYQHYTELSKEQADENARVFNMKEISLPAGGSMHVDYQAQSYGYVEDKTPYVMRHIVNLVASGTDKALLTIDISDFEKNKNLSTEKILKPGDAVYGEIAFYQVSNSSTKGYKDESQTFMVSLDAVVTSLGSVVSFKSDGKKYQIVEVSNPKASDKVPFIYDFKQFMYTESVQMRALKELIPVDCNDVGKVLDHYISMENDGPLEAAKKVVTNVRNVFKSDDKFQGTFNSCFGNPENPQVYSHWSFLRTPVYKGKYTGSSVKTIVLKDGFQYATNPDDGRAMPSDNEYGTRYYYDANGDDSGVSQGVASIEPGGGKSCVLDVYHLVGAGYAPGPNIISSRTTLENIYTDKITDDNIVSRKKGKSVYEFYTARDEGFQFRDNFKSGKETFAPGNPNGRFYLFGIMSYFAVRFGKHRGFDIPVWLPLSVKWDRKDQYHLKSYAYTDNTDIFGRPKSITQLDASGQVIGQQRFNYYGMDEDVPVYKNGFGQSNSPVDKPGKMDQVWSEAYYTKESDINFIQPILLIKAKSNRNFSYTNMKYSYIPPVLKDVSSTLDGLVTTTQNTGFDYYTGMPIEVRSNDSYSNMKIIRTIPAYWKYPEMGSSSVDENAVNNLSANTGTYMYVNDIAKEKLLGAGIVEWSASNANSWGMIDYLQAQRKTDDASTFKYVYTLKNGNDIKEAYNPAAHKEDKYIKRNSCLVKTYKGYTYETELNSDGTFKSFADFTYAKNAKNVFWKKLSTNHLYSQNGVLVESQDVLNKFASQLLGYNYSNTIGAVSNASWAACVYDGAENTYENNSTGDLMLEGNKLQILDAIVAPACEKKFIPRKLLFSFLPGKSIRAHVITIKAPLRALYNKPFAKFNITYLHNTNIKRSFYISLNDNNEYEVFSDQGESFNGFFTYPQENGDVKLLFRPLDFLVFEPDNTFPSSGYQAILTTNSIVHDCKVDVKSYEIPENDCIAEAHTGSYVFKLKEGNSIGTKYRLTLANLGLDEFKRKYKALVWVHKSSPAETQLVVQKYIGGQLKEEYVSLASPYATAGNWNLLRIDFDLSTYPKFSNSDFVDVFMKNPSASRAAIYDDMRILPYHADMTNWVFEHKFNRVTSGLDNDNFASYSNFDERGRVTESSVELQNKGKTVVQKFLYNDQKKQ